MPEVNYKRTYCKTCKDFTLHKTSICEECETEFTPYYLHEVDEGKVMKQRQRYKESQRRKFNDMFQWVNGYGLQNIMEESFNPFIQKNIIECDAGQKEIDENKKKERERLREIKKQELVEYNEIYKPIGRNDKCPCGSDKKYKQCHLKYYQEKGFY